MTDQNGSDPISGKEKKPDDEDIIELTDEIPLKDDEKDQIIELTDEISAESPDENIIELTDEVADEALVSQLEGKGHNPEFGEERELILGRAESAEDQELEFSMEADGEAGTPSRNMDNELDFELQTGSKNVATHEEKDKDIIELTDEVADETQNEGAELDIDLVFDDETVVERSEKVAEDQELEFDLDTQELAEALSRHTDEELEFEETLEFRDGKNDMAPSEEGLKEKEAETEVQDEGEELDIDLDFDDDEEGVLDMPEGATDTQELVFDLGDDEEEASDLPKGSTDTQELDFDLGDDIEGEDEDIIDLTDEVTETETEVQDEGEELDIDLDFGGDEEDTIDLPGWATDTQKLDFELGNTAEDEKILDLTDEVIEEESEAPTEEEELNFGLDLGDDEEEALPEGGADTQELDFDLVDEAEGEDEEILDLTDEVLEEETEALAEEEELDFDLGDEVEGIIEETIGLTDEEADTKTEARAEEEELDFGTEDEAEEEGEEILDLTDEVTEAETESLAEEEELDFDLEDETEEESEEILDLTDEVTEAETEPLTEGEELDFDLDLGGEVDAGEAAEVDLLEENLETAIPDEEMPQKDMALAGAMGIQLDPSRDLSLEPTLNGSEVEMTVQDETAADKAPSFEIPQGDLEAAIERVIESKLAEKIDGLLNSAIEKAVTVEINRLKRMLTDTLSEK